MRTALLIQAVVCALLVGREGPAGWHAQTPSTPATASGALQRGLTLMETRGDCAGAIPHFDTAARGADPAVAARALFVRGQCLERLGRPAEARASYEQFVRRFPTHPLASAARGRAQALTVNGMGRSAVPSLSLRKLAIAEPVPTGTVSGNGRYLALHDANAVPWRHDLSSGRAERLTLGGATDGTRAWHLLLSADGQQVAYTWADDRRRGELRIAPAIGGQSETLVPAGELRAIRPVDWMADGRAILVVTIGGDYRAALQVVDVGTRRMESLYALGLVEPIFVSLSSDGRRILFDHAPDTGPRDIVLLDVASRRVTTVSGHAANDVMPVFLPGGRAFVFASDRLGTLSLWQQDLSIEARTEPTLVRRDIGRIHPMGVSHAGGFIHAVQTSLIDVHTARLGDDGLVAEQRAPVSSTLAGMNQAPDWSPDGAALAYVATRGAIVSGIGARALVVRDTATGSERALYPAVVAISEPRWASDGIHLIVKGRSPQSLRWGLFLVDARTGRVASPDGGPAVEFASEPGPYQAVPGRQAVLVAQPGKGIVNVDLVTGQETTLVVLDAGVTVTAGRGCALAPDGRSLAWSVRETMPGGKPPQAVLRVRDADGVIRELLRATSPDWLMLQAWAPDGRSVFVVRQFGPRPGAAPTRTELWRVPIDGSEPVATGLTSARSVAVHPDGRTVAYVSGSPAWEIWTLQGIVETAEP